MMGNDFTAKQVYIHTRKLSIILTTVRNSLEMRKPFGDLLTEAWALLFLHTIRMAIYLIHSTERQLSAITSDFFFPKLFCWYSPRVNFSEHILRNNLSFSILQFKIQIPFHACLAVILLHFQMMCMRSHWYSATRGKLKACYIVPHKMSSVPKLPSSCFRWQIYCWYVKENYRK